MTRQSNNFTGYSHFSRNEVFRQLGLTIIETEDKPVETPKPQSEPIFEEPEPLVEEVQPVEEPVVEEPVAEETIVEEPQEQPEEAVVQETTDTPEKAETPLESWDLKKAWIKSLKENGIDTIESLVSYLEAGKSLADLSNLSAAAEKSIIEQFEQWQNEQSKTK